MQRSISRYLVLALLISLPGCGEPSTVAPSVPAQVGSATVPELTPSQVRLPASVSLETLRAFAETAVPQTISGAKGLGNFGPTSDNNLSWNLIRTPLTITGGGDQLSLSGSIGGTVRVAGKIKPIRGDIGKILGKANPSQPYSQSADVGADIAASISPRLRADWSIDPNLSARAIVREASARIIGVFDLSFRGELQGPVDDAVNKAVADLTSRIASDRTLKSKAAEVWTKLCEPLPVKTGDGLPELSLRVEPRGFIASQPQIDSSGVRIDAGLDATVRLVSANEPVAACPAFNELLTLAALGDGTTTLNLAAKLSYADINQALEKLRAEQSVIKGNGVEAELRKVTLSSLGNKLLLTVDGTFTETALFGASTTGTLYLAATPRLDRVRQTLGFADVTMDQRSRDAIGKVAESLAAVLSPLIEERLTASRIDLKPLAAKAKDDANAAAAALKSGGGPLKVTEASLTAIDLEQLWHDDTGVHVVIAAKGRLGIEAVNLLP